jgi:predicted RND superfamily exporter protein
MSLLQGLLFSILIVAGIMGLIYKSLRMMIISIIPNVIPLMVIGGLMGFTGLEIKTSTAIIFTIAFGIAVDDTIHLLGKFKFELMKGKSKMDALQTAFLVTGKAMILTTLILCSGFMLLLLSSFNGTFNLGFLLSITLFVALILDLTLLPVLIMYFYKEPKKKSNV